MEMRVISEFREASDWSAIRRVGDVIVVDDARAVELRRLRLAEPVEAKVTVAAETPAAKVEVKTAAAKAETSRRRKA